MNIKNMLKKLLFTLGVTIPVKASNSNYLIKKEVMNGKVVALLFNSEIKGVAINKDLALMLINEEGPESNR